MKIPSAIQLAEDLTFVFQSASDANEQDPQQAVFTLEVLIKLLKKLGFPEPDFTGRALQATNSDNTDVHKAYLRKIGKAIERARLEKGLTVAQLGELTGKAPASVARWESGKANLEISTIRLIEKHLPVKLLSL